MRTAHEILRDTADALHAKGNRYHAMGNDAAAEAYLHAAMQLDEARIVAKYPWLLPAIWTVVGTFLGAVLAFAIR